MTYNYKVKRSVKEAQREVHGYVEPRDCFIIFVNNQWGWQAFSTTGDTPCAHYVAHLLEFTTTKGMACQQGYLIRVTDLVDRLGNPIETDQVAKGDVWARLKHDKNSGGGNEPTSHCGIVSSVTTSPDGSRIIRIKHCSSGQKRVAEDEWAKRFPNSGRFYRPPTVAKGAAVHANLERMHRGFQYRKPFGGGLIKS